MINPFQASSRTQNQWQWPVAFTSLVLGLMISFAWISQGVRNERDPDVRQRVIEGKVDLNVVKQLEKVQVEVSKLRTENTKLQNAMAGSTNQAKVLNEGLQSAKLLAGLTEVTGPGLTVVLMDSQKQEIPEVDRIIHDYDVRNVVNELWAAGAEAIEINGNRLVGTSSIRCVGPTVLVDHRAVASPINIRVIGDSDAMEGGLNLPGGVLDTLRQQDAAMVRLDRVKQHRFKAYTGSTERRFATVPKESTK
jgi:uncharacterized protein YlxW (UPF0749 family)